MTDRQPARAAVVVIHGIGEQPAIATLGRFAQGLVDHAGASQPAPVMRQIAGATVPVLRFRTAGAAHETDVLEFSWQHLVRGRISSFATLGWLLGTVLAPLEFRRHWRVMAAAGAESPSPWLVVLRQLALAVALLLPMVLAPLLIGIAVAWAFSLPLPAPLQFRTDQIGYLLGSTVFAVMALLQVVAIAGDGIEAVAISRRTSSLHGSDWFGLHGGAARGWRLPAMVAVLLSIVLAWLLGRLADGAWAELWAWLLDSSHRQYLAGVGLLVAGIVIGWHFLRWLRDYAGDIALYVTADRQPEADRSRHAIKKGAARMLQALLRDTAYRKVVVVGHSLGSVIALDALNELSREQRLENKGPAAPLQKLGGLLTFGSPLDKVSYFFRERTSDSAAIHAQLLSYLHPTGRLPSHRDDGPYRLHSYRNPLAGLQWINLHAPADIISDPLVFYRVTDRRRLSYFPAGSHSRYWRDPRTFDALDELLRD